MIKSLSIALIALSLSAGALACPNGKCPLKHSIAQSLNIEGERATKLDALEAQFKEEMEAQHAAHKAKLAEILTPEELAKLETRHEKGEHFKKCPDEKATPNNKSPL